MEPVLVMMQVWDGQKRAVIVQGGKMRECWEG